MGSKTIPMNALGIGPKTAAEFSREMWSIANLLELDYACRGTDISGGVYDLRALSVQLKKAARDEWLETKDLLDKLKKTFEDMGKESLNEKPNMDAITMFCAKMQSKVEKFIESKEETR